MPAEARYVPAAGRAAFARFYDPAIALTVREATFRAHLQEQVTQATPRAGTVVDVGCGTGSFALALAAAAPDMTVIGIDGDAGILKQAEHKPGATRVQWDLAMADALPLADDSADAVSMSLLLHHLDLASKQAALAEARRVLRPSGSLHIADWGRPHGPAMRAAFLLLQCLDGFANTRDHAAGRLPAIITEAGFSDVTSTGRLRTMWGSLEIWSAAA